MPRQLGISAAALLFVFLAVLPTAGFAEFSIPPFSATYLVKKAGLNAIEITLSFQHDGETWQLKSHGEPVGIASLFFGGREVTEQTRLAIEGERLIPLEYRYRRVTSDETHKRHYVFDWQHRVAMINYRGDKKTIPLEGNVLDSFSVQLALMRDAKGPTNELTYPVIQADELKTYRFVKLKSQMTDSPAGRMNTLEVRRRENDDEQTTVTTWHATELHYLPIKVEKIEDGETDLLMRLDHVEWH